MAHCNLLPKKVAPEEAIERPFDFLKLSGELRNKIYLLVVVAPKSIKALEAPMPEKSKRVGVARPVEYQLQPAITKVSRQLRQEALPLYYSTNTFDLQSHGLNRSVPLSRFLTIGKDNLSHIRSLTIGCPFDVTVEIKNDRSGIMVFKHGQHVQGGRLDATCDALEKFSMRPHSEAWSGVHLMRIVPELNGRHTTKIPLAARSCSCPNCEWVRLWSRLQEGPKVSRAV